MNKEQIQERLNGKIKAVQTLAESLKLEITAKQVMTKDGFIELAIFFNDREEYPKESVTAEEVLKAPIQDAPENK